MRRGTGGSNDRRPAWWKEQWVPREGGGSDGAWAPEEARRKVEDRAEELEDGPHRDPHQAEGEERQPDEGVQHQGCRSRV